MCWLWITLAFFAGAAAAVFAIYKFIDNAADF